MNLSRLKYFFLLSLIIFAACKNTAKKPVENTGNDPAYQHPSVKMITDKISDDPKNAHLYFERGKALHKLLQDTLAIKDFQQAAKLDSTRAEYFSAVGDLMFEHKDISGSREWLQKAIDRDPRDPRAHLKFAKLLLFLKEYKGSFEQINTVLRADVYNPEAYFIKGRVYEDLKDTSKAISSYQTAIQVAPDFKDAMVQLGLLYSAQKNPLALKYLDNAFKTDTGDVFPLFAKAVFYQNNNDPETAKTTYRECVARDHQYADAYFNMGFLLLQQDSVEKALHQFDLVSKISPNDPLAYYNRGLCNEKLGKKQAAINDYQQALVFDKDFADARAALKKLGAD